MLAHGKKLWENARKGLEASKKDEGDDKDGKGKEGLFDVSAPANITT